MCTQIIKKYKGMGSRKLWYSCEYFEKWEEDIKSKSFSQEPYQKISQCKRNSHRSLPILPLLAGGVGCVSCLLWFVLIYDDPVTHPWINITEKEYIISSLAQQVHIKTLTFSRDLVSASGFIRVTKTCEHVSDLTFLISKFVFRSALLSNLFPSKLWSDLYPSGPCVFAVSAING